MYSNKVIFFRRRMNIIPRIGLGIGLAIALAVIGVYFLRSPSSITVNFDLQHRFKPRQLPVWVAVQVGNQAWRPSAVASEIEVTLPYNEDRFGIAFVCRNEDTTSVQVVQTTRSERSSLRFPACSQSELVRDFKSAPRKIVGNVTGAVPGENVTVSVEPGGELRQFGPYGIAYLQGGGRYEIDANHYEYALFARTERRMALLRKLQQSEFVPLDLNLKRDGFEPIRHTVKSDNGETFELTAALRDAANEVLYSTITQGTNPRYEALPVTHRKPGDHYSLYASSSDASTGTTRWVEVNLVGPRDVTVRFPTVMSRASWTRSGLNEVRFDWEYVPDATTYEFQLFNRHNGGPFRERWLVELSKAWIGQRTSYSVPAFTGLDGWSNLWLPQQFEEMLYTVQGVNSESTPELTQTWSIQQRLQ
jgi:hypothetical protein